MSDNLEIWSPSDQTGYVPGQPGNPHPVSAYEIHRGLYYHPKDPFHKKAVHWIWIATLAVGLIAGIIHIANNLRPPPLLPIAATVTVSLQPSAQAAQPSINPDPCLQEDVIYSGASNFDTVTQQINAYKYYLERFPRCIHARYAAMHISALEQTLKHTSHRVNVVGRRSSQDFYDDAARSSVEPSETNDSRRNDDIFNIIPNILHDIFR